ncbi:MAG: hypothetical protein M3R24_00955 [Chloroflexota bacterium]|nr:hypothetical protein [Chloroflexota bacterium]
MKRTPQPTLSPEGQQTLDHYSHYLSHEQDLSVDTRRNYLSDLRQFAAWCEASWTDGQEAAHAFTPAAVATSLITQYRAYLQTLLSTCWPASLHTATSRRNRRYTSRPCRAWKLLSRTDVDVLTGECTFIIQEGYELLRSPFVNSR